MSYYQGRDFVPMPQEGDGLGDLFASAKPMLMGFARKAGKNLLSAVTSVLKDVLSGKDAKASARQAFSNAGLNLLDDIVDSGSSQPKTQRKKELKSTKKRTPKTGVMQTFLNRYITQYIESPCHLCLSLQDAWCKETSHRKWNRRD